MANGVSVRVSKYRTRNRSDRYAATPATRLPTITWPRMSRPVGPASSGSLSTPAAAMTGVARRNANRAASSWDSPRTRPATMVAPERLIPGRSARICAAPMAVASTQPSRDSRRSESTASSALPPCADTPPGAAAPWYRLAGGRGGRPCPAGAQALDGQQYHAVEGQEQRRRYRLAERRAEQVLEREAGQPDRDGRHDEQPAQALVRIGDLPVPQRREQTDDDARPVLAEEHDQRDRGGDVYGDQERQVRRVGDRHVQVRRPAPAEQRRDQDAVAEAGYREELGDALQQADEHSLEVGQVRHPGSIAVSSCEAGRCAGGTSVPHTRAFSSPGEPWSPPSPSLRNTAVACFYTVEVVTCSRGWTAVPRRRAGTAPGSAAPRAARRRCRSAACGCRRAAAAA